VGEIITRLGKLKNSYRDLFAKHEWEKDFGERRSELEDNIKVNVKENVALVSACFPQVLDNLEIKCHINTVMKSGN
jgi:hypothetical protein